MMNTMFCNISSSDEWEEMCVVAIGEQEVRALQSRGFRDLLSAIGLQPPNEQVIKYTLNVILSWSVVIRSIQILYQL